MNTKAPRFAAGLFVVSDVYFREPISGAVEENAMVMLLHEIWEDYDADGQPLPGCCLAGPDGADFRRMLAPRPRLVHTFEAGSHYEAMIIYYQFLGRGEYTTDQPWDLEPYPDEWLELQQQKRCSADAYPDTKAS